jgi:hypothetical protein
MAEKTSYLNKLVVGAPSLVEQEMGKAIQTYVA